MQIYIQGIFLVSGDKYPHIPKKSSPTSSHISVSYFSSDIVLHSTRVFYGTSLSSMELMSDFYSLNLIQKYLTVSLILQFI